MANALIMCIDGTRIENIKELLKADPKENVRVATYNINEDETWSTEDVPPQIQENPALVA